MSPENVYQRYISARDRNSQGEAVDRWGMYESSIEDYAETFAALNLEGTLITLKQRNIHHPVFTLDLMSAGQAMRDLQSAKVIRKGVSVTLTDWRNERGKTEDHENSLSVIEGDILSGYTWGKVDEWLNINKIQTGLDLIVSRPMAGLNTLPRNFRLHETLFWRAFNLLKKDGGQLFTQVYCPGIPGYDCHEEKDSWVGTLNQLPGITAKLLHSADYQQVATFDILKVTRDQAEDYFDPNYRYTRHSIT